MRRSVGALALNATLCSVLLMGCTGIPVAPTLTILSAEDIVDPGACFMRFEVRLTNNDAGSITASAQGFTLMDANGTVRPASGGSGATPFPTSLSLQRGESAEGGVEFHADEGYRPVTLRYEMGGVRLETDINDSLSAGLCRPFVAPRPSVTLSPGYWIGGDLDVAVTSASLNTIEPSNLSYQVLSTSGTFYFNGASATTTSQGDTNTTVTFNDAGGAAAGKVSSDDHISIHVSPNAIPLHGCTLKVLIGAEEIGTSVLP